MLLAAATGWLPGPGGIPLALVGLAVLSTEFEWARRLRVRAEHWFHAFVGWAEQYPPWLRMLATGAVVVLVLATMWLALIISGVPGWLPQWFIDVLRVLPGVGVAE